MGLKTLPWDAADHLTDEAAMAGYLDAALEDGDPKLVAAVLGDITRAKGIGDVASRAGWSSEDLARLLSADRDPDFSVIMKLIDALGLQLTARIKSTADAL